MARVLSPGEPLALLIALISDAVVQMMLWWMKTKREKKFLLIWMLVITLKYNSRLHVDVVA